MPHDELPSRFSRVDEARDPGDYVDYLDAISALEGTRAYKEVAFGFLEPGPGDRVLDVGCGVGDDARELARRVGPGGRVVGVDGSRAMVEEARRRADAGKSGSGRGPSELAPLEFRLGDARDLPFEDAAFDASRIDRVLQHLERPGQAVRELVRVVRAGGRVVASEPDWETLVVTSGERHLTRRILNHACDRIPGGWMGRELAPLFRDSGLEEVRVDTRALTCRDYETAETVLRLRTFAAHARKDGVVSGEEARRWLRELEARDEEGRFFAALTVFVVGGRRVR